MPVSNAMCVYDIIAYCDLVDFKVFKTYLNNYYKSWCFQKEKGEETGRLHYQARGSLKVKKRHNELIDHKNGLKDNLHTICILLTSNENKDNFFYVMKEDTRVEGPWTDKDIPDEPDYIPRQYRGLMDTLKPFQKTIMELAAVFCVRTIHLIYCPEGNKGKSTIAHLMRLHKKALVLPPLNDADRLLYTACNMAMAKNIRTSVPIFVDLPRAMNQERLYGMFAAIEVIKQGFLQDTRNHSKTWDMDCPSVFVFTNTMPEIHQLMSIDRWRIWTINQSDELVSFKAGAKPPVILETEPSAQPAQSIRRYIKKELKVKTIDTDVAEDCEIDTDSS